VIPDLAAASARAEPTSQFVAADLEGTCTRGETWRGIGRWLAGHGRRGRYRSFLAPRLAALPLVRLGLISRQGFRDRWIRDLARLLDGLTAEELEEVATWVVEEELWPKRRVAVIGALEAAAADGARVVIASGTYEPVLTAFVARVAGGPSGPLVALGTPLEMADGRTTGRLADGRTGSPKADRCLGSWRWRPLRAAHGIPSRTSRCSPSPRTIAVAPDRDRPVAMARGLAILDDPPETVRIACPPRGGRCWRPCCWPCWWLQERRSRGVTDGTGTTRAAGLGRHDPAIEPAAARPRDPVAANPAPTLIRHGPTDRVVP
jgi:phosphoserine phosphatase